MSLTPFQTKAPRLFAQIESKKRVKPVEEPPAELLKKVKQEQPESDDESTRQRFDSASLFDNLNKPTTSSNSLLFGGFEDDGSSTNNEEEEHVEEEWVTELRELVNEGEATLDDYLTDVDTTLKWVVKHGIRLAITCTKCNLMQHDDGCQLMQDHGLICEKQTAEVKKPQTHPNTETYEDITNANTYLPGVEFELNIREIPCPYYGDVTQIALRKSIERNSCKIADLPDEMKGWPLKYIMGKNNRKRAGICTYCGEIFLSIDYKKWVHECYEYDNENNGFLISKYEQNNILNQPTDDEVDQKPDIFNILINKSTDEDATTKDADIGNDHRLIDSNQAYDREWAYSIQSRFLRGELKNKTMVEDSTYCIHYLSNNNGTILACVCTNCSRIFPPKISVTNRTRHIQYCLTHNKKKRKITKNTDVVGTSFNERSEYPKVGRLLSDKRTRARKAYALKRLDKNINYNINLEALMIKTMATDVLPVDMFYSNGMKNFFNKLLRFGYELGQQPGTILPSFEELLPQRDNVSTSLNNFMSTDKLKEIFYHVSNIVKIIGGTLIVESVGQCDPSEENSYVALSFVILDEWIPKRIVCDFILDDSIDSVQISIDSLLNKMNMEPQMCNLFVNKKVEQLLNCDKFTHKSSCFGSFLNHVVEKMFEDSSLTNLSEQDQLKITELKQVLDQAPECIELLAQNNYALASNIRSVLRSEFDSRWFAHGSLAEKLLILLVNYFEIIIKQVEQAHAPASQKSKIIKFVRKAREQLDSLQQYKNFVQIFIKHFEVCTINRRPTAHLVILKFQAIREELKKLVDTQTSTSLNQHFCMLSIDTMDSLEDEFLTRTHFLATLLAPGHRDQLKAFYEEEQILDYENELIQAVNANQCEQSNGSLTTVPNDLELEIERYFEADAPSRIDPLDWWLKNEKLAPRVAALAKQIFTIPAVSTQIDKSIPPHLANTKITETLRARILFNWTASSELQSKRPNKQKP